MVLIASSRRSPSPELDAPIDPPVADEMDWDGCRMLVCKVIERAVLDAAKGGAGSAETLEWYQKAGREWGRMLGMSLPRLTPENLADLRQRRKKYSHPNKMKGKKRGKGGNRV